MTTKPKQPPRITINELSELLAITDRSIRKWVGEGCPCTRQQQKAGGQPALFFNPVEVIDWCGANNKRVHAGSGGSSSYVPPADLEDMCYGDDEDGDLPKAGIVGAVARLRAAEQVSYKAFLEAMKNGESHTHVRAVEKIYLEASEALRRTEKDVHGILETRGEMISIEVVQAENQKIDAAIRTAFLTLPRKLSPELAAIDDAGEIEGMLQDEIDDILRGIASGETLQA